MRQMEPLEVRSHWRTRREIALIDLREEAYFATGHPLFATSIPLGRIELEVPDRIPRRTTTIVLYHGRSEALRHAAALLARAGYEDVYELRGGLEAWTEAGLEMFQDVNSPSKAFGELVEARRHTPMIDADELHRLIAAGAPLTILDARRFDEYATMSIPTAMSAPGAELVLKAATIARGDGIRIIVNCAGRTRSIIGAQSLVNAGYGPDVAALRNGTIGWKLAGLSLASGANEHAPAADGEDLASAQKRARDVAYRAGVGHIGPSDLNMFLADPTRTAYCFDVRAPDEFDEGHVAGFRNAPGGQLVQETDVFAPVRGARIILQDPLGLRADMSASWLAQMGWDVFVLERPPEMAQSEISAEPGYFTVPDVERIDVAALAARIERGAVTIVDLSQSNNRQRGHIPGSFFAIRSMLETAVEKISADHDVILSSEDGRLAAYAAGDVKALRGTSPIVLAGGNSAWRAAGRPLETGLGKSLNDPVDRYRRPYEGADHPHTAMQAYLDWEFGLVAQLERDGSHGFFVI
jgi:rhodanese-related sulfurtransferase